MKTVVELAIMERLEITCLMLLLLKLTIPNFVELPAEFLSCSKPSENMLKMSRVPVRLLLSKYLSQSLEVRLLRRDTPATSFSVVI